jgi:hypothetical protein
MSNKTAGIVDVDGLPYEWALRSEPSWGDAQGWRGMTIALHRQDTQREAVLEFPPPRRLMKGLPRGRLQINDALVSRGICRAASRMGPGIARQDDVFRRRCRRQLTPPPYRRRQ